MSFENLQANAEAAHHSGMVYSDVVEAYLESGEYSSVGDKYSGTSDIRLARPAHKEEKVFRVECKNSEADLKDPGFVTGLARHMIDFHFGGDEFELLIFARDLKNGPRWKDIFMDRIRKRDEVEWLWEKIQSKHNLNDDEVEKFEQLELDDFWVFLEKIGVKKADFGRLIELTEENRDRKKRQKKWEFYVRENEPVKEPGELIPNFFEITHYPEKIWVYSTGVEKPRAGYNKEGVERFHPIWFHDSQLFTLISPEYMPPALKELAFRDEEESYDFGQWIWQNDHTRHIGKILLNKQMLWRGVLQGEHCVVTPDARKLIFETRPVQMTLTDEAESGDEYRTEEKSYVVTRRVNNDVGHRYCRPMAREYSDHHYLFLKTGWLFSAHGKGRKILTGQRAKRASDQLRKDGYDQLSNYRAQLRAWKKHLQIDQGEDTEHPAKVLDIAFSQRIGLKPPSNLELPVRPPHDGDERDLLMEGERVV